ncbi:MAG: hypothetical protein IH946_06680 [Bacteroidetes bacterium]|nr:hypothetical protein [Bacteroidota bacterium]
MRYLIFILSWIILSSCSNDQKHHAASHHHHQVEDGIVSLNNGAKWKANKETTEGVNEMIKALQDFEAGTDQDVDAFHRLGKSLNKEYNKIFKNCTMTGAAHDQLHNYLLPMAKDINHLMEGELHECREKVASLDKKLLTYEQYFE